MTRLTVGQAVIRFLTAQYSERDGEQQRLAPGCFGIAAFADWAWNPRDYEPDRAAEAALRIVAGTDDLDTRAERALDPAAAALAPLVRTLSSWPPSAPMDSALARAADAALDGGDDGELRERLEELAALGSVAVDAEPARSLRPWLEAAADMGAAGLMALDHARGAASRVEVEAALARAEGHDKKVAVDVVPAFVRATLERVRV